MGKDAKAKRVAGQGWGGSVGSTLGGGSNPWKPFGGDYTGTVVQGKVCDNTLVSQSLFAFTDIARSRKLIDSPKSS